MKDSTVLIIFPDHSGKNKSQRRKATGIQFGSAYGSSDLGKLLLSGSGCDSFLVEALQ